MRICVGMDYRFDRAPDGTIWTSMAFEYEFFWSHYLTAFDSVRVIARLHDIREAPAGFRRADGPLVTFAPVPFYLGPIQYALRYRQIARVIRENIGGGDAVLGRVPAQVCNQMLAMLEPGRPFGVHVVGNPHASFAPGATQYPFRPFFRRFLDTAQRRQCARAAAAAYVTKAALQSRYPCPNHTTVFSCVKVHPEAFVTEPRPLGTRPQPGPAPFTLVTVGSLENPHKAVDVQIDAVADCIRAGLDVRLVVIGDGRLQDELQERARGLGLGDRVHFLGRLLAGKAVRDELDRADVFVLPSRTEGLPRAMIEAMARALPCIGSTVGGIPELLPPEYLVPPGDAAALASKIRDVVGSAKRMAEMSARNLKAAQEYREDILHPRRVDFYKFLRDVTQRWLARGSPATAGKAV
jgi:glycosyltransferase involved in cell wall biosynthesis